MGGKPRKQPDIVTLAKELHTLQSTVARQQVLASEATAALKESKAALVETRQALLAAAKDDNGAVVAAVKSSRVPKPKTKTKKTTKRRAKAKSAAHWEARQAALIKSMKKGVLYDSAQLQELAGCERESKHRFAANVRKPLLAGKKLKKTRADKSNRSPRAVRWVRP